MRAPRAPNKCSVCNQQGHNKRNCPDNNNCGQNKPQRVGNRPVENNGNGRALESQDLDDEGRSANSSDSEGLNGEDQSDSDGDSDDDWDVPEEWKDVDIEDVPPDANPAEIGLPAFTDYPNGFGFPVNVDDIYIDPNLPISETLHNSLLSTFHHTFTPEIVNKFVTATNAHGAFKSPATWKVIITAEEFHAFLGCIIYLGIFKYPTRKLAWSRTQGSMMILRGLMPRRKFEHILANWRYIDVTMLSKAQLNQLKQDDPFWAVTEFLEDMNEAFGSNWNPGQCMDIDEQCCPWKGRHKCRCYDPKKPEKWHFKIYALNCSRSGYLVHFKIYKGKGEVRPEGISATAYPVHALLEPPRFHHRGHVLFTDNWYTSLQSVKLCGERGIHSVGTIKANRKGLPVAPKKVAGLRTTTMARGETRTRSATFGDRKLFYTIWRDRKPVRLLHTIPTMNGTCRRQVKDNRTKTWGRRQFQRATIIPVYNNNMGGTDKGDQGGTYYRPRVKTRNWITRIFAHFINIGCVNTLIITQHLSKVVGILRPILPKSQLSYRLKIVNALAKDYQEQGILHEAQSHQRTQSKKQWEKDYSRLIGAHHHPLSEPTEGENRFEGKKRP